MHLRFVRTGRHTIRCVNASSKEQSRFSSSLALSHSVYEPSNPAEQNGAAPLLITHGLLGSKFNWNSIAKATARATNRKVVTFDARNHGDSPHTPDITYDLMSEDILRLSQQLQINTFSLMGHSMGGRTVMTYALKYPNSLDKLIVVDVSPLQIKDNVDFESMIGLVQALYDIGITLVEGQIMPLSEARKIADAALIPVVKDPAIRAFLLTNLSQKEGRIIWKANLKVLIEKFSEIGNFPQQLLANKFDKPTLFIRGGKSSYISESDFPLIQKTFTKARLETVENAGHWPHAENTKRFMEILLPFINS